MRYQAVPISVYTATPCMPCLAIHVQQYEGQGSPNLNTSTRVRVYMWRQGTQFFNQRTRDGGKPFSVQHKHLIDPVTHMRGPDIGSWALERQVQLSHIFALGCRCCLTDNETLRHVGEAQHSSDRHGLLHNSQTHCARVKRSARSVASHPEWHSRHCQKVHDWHGGCPPSPLCLPVMIGRQTDFNE